MKDPVRSNKACPGDDNRTKDPKSTTLVHEQQPNLRYIFLTSFILILVSCYLYPCILVRQENRRSKMMTSRTSRYSNFAGAISEKLQNDRFWLEGDKSHWYHVEFREIRDVSKDLGVDADDIVSKFVQLDADEDTKLFIQQSIAKADQILMQMWHNLAKTVLKRFFGYTQTDINGYLRRGSMFVISTSQFILMREKAGLQTNLDNPEGSLIDLGAGDGQPTDNLRPFYKDTYATEASWAMRDILKEKNVKVLDIDDWDVDNDLQRSFDAIACLNLLDRCENPISILRRIKKALKPGGILLIAIVLPFNPYVEFNSSHEPVEKLLELNSEHLQSNEDSKYTFEKQVPSVVKTLQQEGFSIDAWTRVPYLCEGDMGQSLYFLSDAVFLCTLNEK